jgi:hypothetical protein
VKQEVFERVGWCHVGIASEIPFWIEVGVRNTYLTTAHPKNVIEKRFCPTLGITLHVPAAIEPTVRFPVLFGAGLQIMG